MGCTSSAATPQEKPKPNLLQTGSDPKAEQGTPQVIQATKPAETQPKLEADVPDDAEQGTPKVIQASEPPDSNSGQPAESCTQFTEE